MSDIVKGAFVQYCRAHLAAVASDRCLCCRLPKDSPNRGHDWSCDLSDLVHASELGCHRFSLLVRCIACYDPKIFARSGSLEGTWDSWFDITLEADNVGPDDFLQLDIFHPGSKYLLRSPALERNSGLH